MTHRTKTINLNINKVEKCFIDYLNLSKVLIEDTLFAKSTKEEKDSTLKAMIANFVENLVTRQEAFVRLQAQLNDPKCQIKSELVAKLLTFELLERQIFGLGLSSKSTNYKINQAMYEVETAIVISNILDKGRRVDGRKTDEIRPISTQVGVLPEVHGSSLFNRGETQVLNVLTLGTLDDALQLDGIEDIYVTSKRYIHHYNFPSYSVGETGRYSGTGRREIGHGALAEKALMPVLPTEDEFPYTMRLVSECLGSNGSTSMASTCGSSMSLMHAGVPIKAAVAGIAMGAALDEASGRFAVLTDIQGMEDHHAHMDFKVTGTSQGVTAIQLDNKVGGLTVEVLSQALNDAKKGRIFILGKMAESINKPNLEIASSAPKVKIILVPQSKIREVIGSGGAVINGLQTEFGVQVSLENETGKTVIYGTNNSMVEACYAKIASMIHEFKIGETITGPVVRIEKFGAFFRIDNSDKDAMVHISELGNGKRLETVEEVLKLGDRISCTIMEINDRGQFKLKFNGKM